MNYVSAWSSLKYACVGQVKPQETKRVGLPSGMNLMSNHIAMVRQSSAVLEEVTTIAMLAHAVNAGCAGTNNSERHLRVDEAGDDRHRTVPCVGELWVLTF